MCKRGGSKWQSCHMIEENKLAVEIIAELQDGHMSELFHL